MKTRQKTKFHSLTELWSHLADEERIITDVLRQIITENLPENHKEKLAWNVPCYYVNKMICIIWPASIPGGGVKKGVLLGFAQGFRLKDRHKYLEKGTNKKIYYKIILTVDDIDERAIKDLIKESLKID